MTIKPNLDINQGKLHLHSSFGVHYVIKKGGALHLREDKEVHGGVRRKEREK